MSNTALQIEEVQDVTYKVNGKIYKTLAEAEAAQEALANLALGLEFAEAQYPDLADRAKRTKANNVAEYLTWVENGKPVKEASEGEDEGAEG